LAPALAMHAKVTKFGCVHSFQQFAGVGGVAVF
jgi:hypothetical protein